MSVVDRCALPYLVDGMVEAFAARSLYSCTSEKQLFFHSANESKPATQCEAPDLLQAWCSAHGVQHVEGAAAPLVFFKGFTRDFRGQPEYLAGVDRGHRRRRERRRLASLPHRRRRGLPRRRLRRGRLQRRGCQGEPRPVVVVGKSGVGGAIDAYTLNE